MEKLKIPFPIIVEGKYDKIKLCSVVDAQIFTTDGFGVFKKVAFAGAEYALTFEPILTIRKWGGAQNRRKERT